MTETKSFAKELSKLHDQIQRAWVKTKEKMLVDTTMSGLNFKHFIDGGEQVCSVRLNKAYGAHLRRLDSPPGWLEAFRVGDHKVMGHG